MSEYLWDMSWNFMDPTMIADLHQIQTIDQKALYSDRHTGAQVAFVFDENYKNYFGYSSDPYYYTPSKGIDLFDAMKSTWARAGVPFDMIFLDQLNTSMTYKVYVFVHTVGLTSAQISTIQSVVERNGNVGIFLWADGFMNGSVINLAGMSTLTGMNIQELLESSTMAMSATTWAKSNISGVSSSTLMGTLSDYYGGATGAMTFYPTFCVSDTTATAIADYTSTSNVGIAMKQFPGWTSIYSASVNLVPQLLRYVMNLAGVFQYTNTQDICYVNNSFIGIHAMNTENLTITLPSAGYLYDVFGNVQYGPSTSFVMPVTAGNAYLYYRGTSAQWQALGQ